MTTPSSSIFESISNSPEYKKYLEQIPEAERPKIIESLRSLCNQFEQRILLPLETNLKKR
jgi:hypothetical protein